MTNYANQTGITGINMHYFSKDECMRQKRIGFVSIHRKDFVHVKKRSLCCVPFDDIVVLIWWGRKLGRVGYIL